MTVKDYALESGFTIQEVLEKCKELDIKASNGDDYLDDDGIIMLDNTMNLISTETEMDYNDADELDEAVENIMLDSNLQKKDDNSTKKQKLKKKTASEQSKNDYLKNKKEMYKNKEKLSTNTIDENVILYKDGMTLKELSDLLSVNATDVMKKLINMGLMITINQNIDYENAEIIALEYGKTLKREETQDISNFEEYEIIDNESDLVKRPPVITIMGHVDHGKTSLLDYIRNSNVVAGEFGGITQHIGAYQIEYNGEKITFIDTPGHAAFTEMRARGASVTDIVIIIVAADDGVMPQTEEAIDHAKAAGVPILVAVNKIDKPGANPEKVMNEMAARGLTPEEWGGDIIYTNISAKTGEGIDKLLDNIQLITEMEDLKANPNRYAIGTVIESKLDKNVGSTVTLLVQNGTLRLGDPIVVGTIHGKVRTLKNDLGKEVVEATPSTPVEITGLPEVPSSGDKFMAFETEKEAKTIAENRALQAKLKKDKSNKSLSLDDLFNKIQSGIKEINVVLKTDVKGTEEAVKNALSKIEVEDVRIKVIRSGVGTITESDIVLANASNAIIVGFNVRPSSKTMEVAKEYNVDIRLHNIIYKLVEEMEDAMKGMLDPEYEEKVLGEATVKKIFTFSKVGTIAGSMVNDGIIKKDAKARLIRDGIVIYDGEINSIQKEKDQVKEVKKGFECGITLVNYNDIKENDVIEAYEMVEIKR